MSYDSAKDGIDHINIYSKGATVLGRFLSNFTRQRIVTEDGEFESIEGYWYWLGVDPMHPDREKLQTLWGLDAKRLGQQCKFWLGGDPVHVPNFQHKIMVAMEIKLDARPDMRDALVESTLPLAHYYCYGSKVIPLPKFSWIIDHWEYLRKELKMAAETTEAPSCTCIRKVLLGEEIETDTTVRKDPRTPDDGGKDALALSYAIPEKAQRLSGSAAYKAGFDWALHHAIEGAEKWEVDCRKFSEATQGDPDKIRELLKGPQEIVPVEAEVPIWRDIWGWWDEGYYAVITTNLQTNFAGEAVMGAGLAKQAKERFPGLAKKYGEFIKAKGHGFYLDDNNRVICVPTKNHWKDPASLEMVKDAVVKLKMLPEHVKRVAVPPLGCGLGKLKYTDVLPILEALPKGRFALIPPGGDSSEQWRS